MAALGVGLVSSTGVLAWRAMVLRWEQQRAVGIPRPGGKSGRVMGCVELG